MPQTENNNYINNQKFFDLFTTLQRKVNDIHTDINNGLKSDVKENTKEIDNLSKCLDNLSQSIEDLKRKIDSMDSYEKGREDAKTWFLKWGGWIVSILSIAISFVLKFWG